jgi:hypothetical protein
MKQFAKEVLAVVSIAVGLLAWAIFLVTLTGCAARKPRVLPPNRPVYILAFDRPHVDCVELERKPGTAVRLWACPPEVPHARTR